MTYPTPGPPRRPESTYVLGARDLRKCHRVAVGIPDPGGPEPTSVEDPAPVGLQPRLVVLLEDDPARGEIVHRLIKIVDGPAGDRCGRAAGVVRREVDEDPGPVRAGVANALLFLLAGHESQLFLVETLCRGEVGYGRRRLDGAITESHGRTPFVLRAIEETGQPAETHRSPVLG